MNDLEFLPHDGFESEIAALERRFRTIREGLARFQLLCQKQFHPTQPQQVIAPAKLHRVSQNTTWTLWKVELVIPHSGLRPNQWPRLWFAVKGNLIVFLCVGSHVDNYDDNEMNRIALRRLGDVF
jgi:hypothetical protein